MDRLHLCAKIVQEVICGNLSEENTGLNLWWTTNENLVFSGMTVHALASVLRSQREKEGKRRPPRYIARLLTKKKEMNKNFLKPKPNQNKIYLGSVVSSTGKLHTVEIVCIELWPGCSAHLNAWLRMHRQPDLWEFRAILVYNGVPDITGVTQWGLVSA